MTVVVLVPRLYIYIFRYKANDTEARKKLVGTHRAVRRSTAQTDCTMLVLGYLCLCFPGDAALVAVPQYNSRDINAGFHGTSPEERRCLSHDAGVIILLARSSVVFYD